MDKGSVFLIIVGSVFLQAIFGMFLQKRDKKRKLEHKKWSEEQRLLSEEKRLKDPQYIEMMKKIEEEKHIEQEQEDCIHYLRFKNERTEEEDEILKLYDEVGTLSHELMMAMDVSDDESYDGYAMMRMAPLGSGEQLVKELNSSYYSKSGELKMLLDDYIEQLKEDEINNLK